MSKCTKFAFAPDPARGPYSFPPDLAVFKVITSKGRGGREKGERGRKGNGEGRGEEVEGGIWPIQKYWHGTPYGHGPMMQTHILTHISKMFQFCRECYSVAVNVV